MTGLGVSFEALSKLGLGPRLVAGDVAAAGCEESGLALIGGTALVDAGDRDNMLEACGDPGEAVGEALAGLPLEMVVEVDCKDGSAASGKLGTLTVAVGVVGSVGVVTGPGLELAMVLCTGSMPAFRGLAEVAGEGLAGEESVDGDATGMPATE
ncbi:hypothetical protein ABBQ38_000956 [Trebouxia sp. C0009 RCD-2024]